MSVNLVIRTASAEFAGRSLPFSVGSGGIGIKQAEGDGITPIGRFALGEVWYRADRLSPRTALPCRVITPDDGWSDDPRDPRYNQHVRLPHAFSHEKLHRDAPVYDLLAVMDYNINPIRSGRGSAVFLHIWRGADQPTAGCIAMPRDALLWVLAQWTPDSRVDIQP